MKESGLEAISKRWGMFLTRVLILVENVAALRR